MGRTIWNAASQARWEAEHASIQPKPSTSTEAEAAETEVEPILTWGKAPFDVDGPLGDDHVYEAFIDPSTSVAVEPELPTTPVTRNDCPETLDPNPTDDLEPPVTPSSGVFHSHTLPLTLPSNRHRVNPSPSSTTMTVPRHPEVRLNATSRLAERRGSPWLRYAGGESPSVPRQTDHELTLHF